MRILSDIDNLDFLIKYLKIENMQFKTLNLNNNKLGQNIEQLCDLIELPEFKFEKLLLRNNQIKQAELNFLCSSVISNNSIKTLDISDNLFDDASLKVLYPFL